MPKKQIQKKAEDSVLLEPSKYQSLQDNFNALGVDINVETVKAKSLDIRNEVIQDLVKGQQNFFELLKKNDPTQIPFLTTSQGNILVNPSTVSLSTLQKVAQNEVVAKNLEMNVVSIFNSVGRFHHDDPKCEKNIRKNLDNCNGGMRRIVENIYTAQVFGHSTNYIREHIADNGELVFDQLDLLPPATVLFTATGEGNIADIFQYIYTYPYANTQNLFSFPFNYTGVGSPADPVSGIDPLASYSNADFVLRTNILNTFGLVRLDKEKAVHFTLDNTIKIANPYGWNPLTRRVYDLVMLYDLYKELHSTFLSYKACPLLVGYANRNQVVDDPNGSNESINALDALYDSMRRMSFNGALLLSGMKDEIYHIEAIQTDGNADFFIDSLEYYDKQIDECMGQFSMEESSYASATTQAGFYGRLVANKKDAVTDIIRNTIVKRLLRHNIDKNITDFGRFEDEVQNLDDQLKSIKLFGEAVGTGGFNPKLLKKDNDFMRTNLKQPLLNDEEFKELKESEDTTRKPNNNAKSTNVSDEKPHYKKGAAGGL